MTNRLPPPTGHDEGEEPTVELAKGRTHFQQLTTPRAASIAGILFSLLFSASVILLRTAMPQGAVAGTACATRAAEGLTSLSGCYPLPASPFYGSSEL